MFPSASKSTTSLLHDGFHVSHTHEGGEGKETQALDGREVDCTVSNAKHDQGLGIVAVELYVVALVAKPGS